MKYGIIQQIKYLFNYSRTVVHLQLDTSILPNITPNSSFFIKEMDIKSNDDLIDWISIVNDGYDDVCYTIEQARVHFDNHLFLDFISVFILYLNNEPVATYGIGRYLSNGMIGGSNRLVVKKKHQGLGIGKYLFLYGLNKLRDSGLRYVEHIVSIPRTESIRLHFRFGFIPQTNKKYFQYKNQRRSFIINFLVKRRLLNIYNQYLQDFSKKFCSSVA